MNGLKVKYVNFLTLLAMASCLKQCGAAVTEGCGRLLFV